MVNEEIQKSITQLYKKWSGNEAEKISKLPGAGSNRQFYRLWGNGKSIIGVAGEIARENEAFIYLCRHFEFKGLAVPEVLANDNEHGVYLLRDLGDISLFSLVSSRSESLQISPSLHSIYKQVMEDLVRFQNEGSKNLDYSQCYPVPEFDRQSMQWDLNYFKYYGLKTLPIEFDEHLLELDFQKLMKFLGEADSGFFMYRDFQTRNIFIHNEMPWYIDFQGGRRGPLQYDVASLLFQAKADLPNEFREEMLNHYLDKISETHDLDRDLFIKHYHGFVLLRTLQVLGAYGFRGRIEQKAHFLTSIPFALKNLRWFLSEVKLPIELPELYNVLHQLTKTQEEKADKGLHVEISSFSFPGYGYPKDTSGNGGGFVFDCRALPNPGRYAEYKTLTGRDASVIEFLEKKKEMSDFLEHVFAVIDQAVENYLERGFDHLSVSFGCTGGQHRSVYGAEQLFARLKQRYPANITLSHRMQDQW